MLHTGIGLKLNDEILVEYISPLIFTADDTKSLKFYAKSNENYFSSSKRMNKLL